MWGTIWAFIAAFAVVLFFAVAMILSLRILRRLDDIGRKRG